jgi:hypothetical protein
MNYEQIPQNVTIHVAKGDLPSLYKLTGSQIIGLAGDLDEDGTITVKVTYLDPLKAITDALGWEGD